ncbi:MAG: amino acid adenylation domain-containing protein, partial [Methylococcales bacterium]|nr:amino acid adenylation domain-containing protein [Methylococcales bacterium]
EEYQQQVNYWQHQLDDVPVLSLPLDHARGSLQTFAGASVPIVFNKATSRSLNALSQRHDMTLFMTMLASFNVLLQRYSGQTDFCVGTPIAGRTRADLEPLIGCFINTLAIRHNGCDDLTFNDYLKRVKTQTLAAYSHQELPFEKVVELVQPDRNLSITPLFQVLFTLQSAMKSAIELPDIQVDIEELTLSIAKFDLTLTLSECDDRIEGNFEYNTDLFEVETIIRMSQHFHTLVEGIAVSPDNHLSELPLLSSSELQQILVDWNDTTVEPNLLCVDELVSRQALTSPNATAVIFADEQLSYAQLELQTNQLAHYLLEQGLERESIVGVCIDRSLNLLISLLAVIKAGAVYLPLDPHYPAERLHYMLTDSSASLLITESNTNALLAQSISDLNTKIIYLDSEQSQIEARSQSKVNVSIRPEQMVYMIYTSGSTGNPKGVCIEHRHLMNFLCSMKKRPGLQRKDRLLAVTSASFDIHTLELYLPLVSGATLVIASWEATNDAQQLAQLLIQHKISIMQATPSTWKLLLADGWQSQQNIKVLCGGEAMSLDLRQQLLQNQHIELWNMYGPTETTVWSCTDQITSAEAKTTLGRPINNTQLYILDAEFNIMPIGAAGELHIAGAGVARGYWNRPELTAEKFIQHQFSNKPSQILYKTGDRARYLSGGSIEFLGRLDDQVKLRGFRIELGEIEAELNQQPQIEDSVVMVVTEQNGQQNLRAFIVTDMELDIKQCRSALAKQLPDYMIPSHYMAMSHFPLTNNGKINKKVLLQLDISRSSKKQTAPRDETESTLADIFISILGIDSVDIDDNFFEIGGHSLLATQVISQIRQQFQREIALRTLFERPTIAALAEAIQHSGLVESLGTIEIVSREADLPLSFAQERLWFLDQLADGQSQFYHIPGVIHLQGIIDKSILTQTFATIVERHESLRTIFSTVNEQPVQQILNACDWQLNYQDLTELSIQDAELETQKIINNALQKPFDLSKDYPFVALLIQQSAQQYTLLVNMHHIISDGWSISILTHEVATLYDAFRQGRPDPLPNIAIQYADYASWQRQWLQGELLSQQEDYWLDKLAEIDVLELPLDLPRPTVKSYQGASVSFNIDEVISEKLRQLSQSQGCTLFMTLLTAFYILLHRYSGQTDICVGTPIAGRNRSEIESLIGFFINTLALRIDLSGNPSVTELQQRVKQIALEAYAHQDIPFEKVVEKVQSHRDLSHSPIFQVLFVLQNMPGQQIVLPELTMTPETTGVDSAKFDLTMTLLEQQSSGQIIATLNYNTDLFVENSIVKMQQHFVRLLEGMVEQPDQNVSALQLLSQYEQQLIENFNHTQDDYDQSFCIHQLFEKQAQQRPDRIAVVCGGHRLSFKQLNEKSNQLAHYLMANNVKSGDIVGICLHRQVEMMVALWAILKTGAAYLPLDPNSPTTRLAFMLDDTNAELVITQQSLQDCLPKKSALVLIDNDWIQIAQQRSDNPVIQMNINSLVYIIYTSGSTGEPKGVCVAHRNLLHLSHALDQAIYKGGESLVVTFNAPLVFDASVKQWQRQVMGDTLVILPLEARTEPQQLRQILIKQKVQVLDGTPALIELLMTAGALDDSEMSLEHVLIGGESMSQDLWDRLAEMPSVNFYNVYGPTEATVDSSLTKITKNNIVNIGKALNNVQLYVLDRYKNNVPVGVIGELAIAGDGVTLGYHQRKQLTAEKFIDNPFEDSSKLSNKGEGVVRVGERLNSSLYLTGDLVRYLPDGRIQFVGRLDDQVKVRGYRIELSEIEHALITYPEITQCAVFKQTKQPHLNAIYLVGYYLSQHPINHDVLRKHLATSLPDYMIPNTFMHM